MKTTDYTDLTQRIYFNHELRELHEFFYEDNGLHGLHRFNVMG